MKNWEKYEHELAEWIAATGRQEMDIAVATGCFRPSLPCALCPCAIPSGNKQPYPEWLCGFTRDWLNREADV